MDWSIRIRHIFRESNRVADALTKLSFNVDHSRDLLLFCYPPSEVEPLLSLDLLKSSGCNSHRQVTLLYWDVVWSETGSIGTTGTFERIFGTGFNVIVENEEQVEISFTRMWDPSLKGKLSALNIDKRYVMLRNSSGFYSYAIFEHLKEWPAFNIPQIRIVFKLRKDKYGSFAT
ncbi:hypothetical protein RIF29_16986 [Crotalaria pallida]|uniref:Uncharacterized protein n=1 Tax=Crotalaria pallida TaxID=3830 RepID=A0AAN9IG18_CROPI